MANTNKQFEIKGNEIIVRYPIAPVKSGTGKSMTIASSRGKDTFTHDGKTVSVNFNAYVSIGEWEGSGIKS